MLEKCFLYIDILGFSKMTMNCPEKIKKIFKILDEIKAHHHSGFRTIVFSDTILVFNENDSHGDHYYITYLCEFVQDLFYRTIYFNVYFRAVITKGEFKYQKLNHIESYYGKALVDCYNKEKKLKSIGLFIDKKFSKDVVTFKTVEYDVDFNYVILTQSFDYLNTVSKGVLPIEDEIFEETDMLDRIDEDLLFFREIEYLKNNHADKSVRFKYRKTYGIFKKQYPKIFKTFEVQGFLPMTISLSNNGRINPFEIRAKNEIDRCK